MKKILYLFIALTLVLGSICPVANAYEKVSYTDIPESDLATEYLKMMQIADEDDFAGDKISRGDAVVAIIMAMGLYDTAISVSHEYYTNEQKAALFAHRAGILASSDPAGWNLDGNVTLAQAAKMFVVALGYNAHINPDGAYPMGYLTKASNLKLLAGVTVSGSEDALSGADFATMLYNAMQTSVMEVSGIYGDGVSYVINENTTLETLYLKNKGWKTAQGIVTQDSFGSMYPDTEVENNVISIDGVSFINNNPEFNGYVGYRVKYVATDKSENKSELVGMMITDDNTAIYLDSENEAYHKDGFIYYYISGETKEQKLSLSQGVIFTVNGTLSQSFTISNIDFSNGNYEFIDNDADNKFDIVKCDYSQSFVVNFVKDDIIYLKNGVINSKNIIDLSEKADVSYSIYDTKGNSLNISDISADDGITVIASEDFSYVEIIKLDPPCEITISEASEDKVMANGTWYKVGNISAVLRPGETYTARINEKGVIYHVSYEYADCVYVMEKGRNTSAMDDTALLKVYDIKTGINVLSAANKVTIDGTSYTGNDLIYSNLPQGTLVRIDTNSNGEFTKVTELTQYGETATRMYCKYASAFNDTAKAESVPFRFDENTLFFTVPENGYELDYGVEVTFKDNYEYVTRAFDFDDETGTVKAAVVIVQTDMKTNLTYKADVAVISKVTQVSLNDGEATYKITGFDDGKEFTYTAGQYDDVFRVCSTLGSGDVVRYIVNYSDEIVAIERITELSKASSGFNNGKNTADEQIFGQALSLDKNVITNNSKYLYHRLGMSTNLSFNNISSMEFFAHVENTVDPESQFADYYVYDKRTKEVSVASVDDIITYEMAGDGASWIFVQKSYTDVKCIVIVK